MDNLEQALLESENSLMLLSDEELITPINDILIINPETRLIEVPSTELLLGVFSENLVEKKYFKCPRIVLNNIDLYECFIFINYVSANGRIGSIQSENVELDETEQYILFDWDLTNNVFDKNKDSTIYFSVSAKQYLEDSEPVFATRKAQGKMYETINGTEHVTQEHADIILQILAGMKTKVDLPKDEDGNLLAPEEGQTLLFREDGTTYYGTPSSGSAKDVTYDDAETKLGAENVQDAIGKLSEEIDDIGVNANSYGIVGDGIMDVAPKFTQLVSKLSENGGGTIYLPNGEYLLKSRVTWKSNVSLVGESHNAILKPYCDNSVSQGFAAISWLNTDGTQQGYSEDNPMVNCHFSNFTIDGIEQNPSSYDSYPKGINIHFMKDCSFEDIQFLNTFATGLGVDFLENVFIHNIYCYNCGRGYTPTDTEGIAGGAGIGIGTMGMAKETCVISDCITDRCGNYGIFLEGGSIFQTNGCQSHYTIANCQTINGRNYGIVVKGTDNVMVTNNTMKNNARDGFALLYRPDRSCNNVYIEGNTSVDNAGCGYRLADGDNVDNISKNIFVRNNVALRSGKDGILVSSLYEDSYIENNVIDTANRGIAIAEQTYTNLYIGKNKFENCETDYVCKGLFKNDNLFYNQLVQMVSAQEVGYDKVYVDNSGEEIEHDASKTTSNFTYCKGSAYCGFYFETAYVPSGDEWRICYVHWYDKNKNFISREGATVNGIGYKRFTPPEGAFYVKYRVGINKGELKDSQIEGVYLVKYMTDRCEDEKNICTISGKTFPLEAKHLSIIERVGGDTLTWDGNTEGLESFTSETLGFTYYKVSDVIPNVVDGETVVVTITAPDGKESVESAINTYGEIFSVGGFIFIIPQDGYNFDNLIIEKKGIYFVFQEEGVFISSLTINGYTGFIAEKIKEEYLPEIDNILKDYLTNYALKSEVPSVEGLASEEYVDNAIPLSLPNPHPLKFTGGVSGEYTGAEELVLDIPIGGEEVCDVLADIVLEEEVTWASVNIDNPQAYKAIYFYGYIKNTQTNTKTVSIAITINGNTSIAYLYNLSQANYQTKPYAGFGLINEYGIYGNVHYIDGNSQYLVTTTNTKVAPLFATHITKNTKISRIAIGCQNDNVLGNGTTFKVYGVR